MLAELLLEALRRRRPPNVHMRDTAQMIRRLASSLLLLVMAITLLVRLILSFLHSAW